MRDRRWAHVLPPPVTFVLSGGTSPDGDIAGVPHAHAVAA